MRFNRKFINGGGGQKVESRRARAVFFLSVCLAALRRRFRIGRHRQTYRLTNGVLTRLVLRQRLFIISSKFFDENADRRRVSRARHADRPSDRPSRPSGAVITTRLSSFPVHTRYTDFGYATQKA